MVFRVSSKKKRSSGSTPVYLNVYDLNSKVNGYAYWLGLGAYHSGVEVHGIEFAFGFHEDSTTGIFEVEPKQCEGFAFRKSILLGWTEMGLEDVTKVMEEIGEEFKGNAYNIVKRNCNHFCNAACVRLAGKRIPGWVNRLARIGLLCHCMIPVSLNSTKVRDDKRQEENKVSEEEKKEVQ